MYRRYLEHPPSTSQNNHDDDRYGMNAAFLTLTILTWYLMEHYGATAEAREQAAALPGSGPVS